MRFTNPALNNDYFDEDYLRVFGFKAMGKNVKAHRSVVFMEPSKVTVGSNITIWPYCVFGKGTIDLPSDTDVEPFTYVPGTPDEAAPDVAQERIAELEAELARLKDDRDTPDDEAGPGGDLRGGGSGA